ncbi:unnamed protein product [Leptosia nina]|uniref:Uncharacterized protein n=1 Tax=Leptosia nina TaxID=320188 RepID=A0AAV1K172_9NEOP
MATHMVSMLHHAMVMDATIITLCCGEPYSMPSQPPQRLYTCMGQCNAPKLYADTYNFLNENLMQPVVKEVYNDLSTINPANTIMNNEMGNKMGLTAQGQTSNITQNSPNIHFNPGNQLGSNSQMMLMPKGPEMAQGQQNLSGMGPQIMNMIKGESIVKQQPANQLTGPMVVDAPPSYGQIGVEPTTAQMNPNFNGNHSIPQYTENRSNNSPQQQQLYSANFSNTMPNAQQPGQQPNPIQQTSMTQQPSYGQHSQGMKKFNEMFPGVIQGLGGDLGFDPMAIAIQMNPANQQQVAMDTMQKMMNTNQNISKILEPSTPAQPAQNANTVQNMVPISQMISPNQTTSDNTIRDPVYNMTRPNQSTQQQLNTPIKEQNQQVYNATVNQAANNPNILSSQQVYQMSDPNTGAPTSSLNSPNLSHLREELPMSHSIPLQQQAELPQHSQQISSQGIIKEPIFPVDTTKQKIYHNLHGKKYPEPAHFNTLGQPVEKLPANMYHQTLPALPQTLSPQTSLQQGKYANVKQTESKTALMSDKPTDKVPSRSQLQQIYNQYKGSQSFTQQSVKQPVEALTHSERRFNIGLDKLHQDSIPVEKVGGDSTHNRQPNELLAKNTEYAKYDRIGDVPIQKNTEVDLKPEKDMPSNNRKFRNGLQDMIYTSYPTSAAWTFHGDGQQMRSYQARRERRYYRY